MENNRTGVNGILIWWTRIQMWSQGFYLRFKAALICAVLFAAVFMIFRPPTAISIDNDGGKIGLIDAAGWECATYAGFKFLYPDFVRETAELSERQQLKQLAFLHSKKREYWNQYWKYLYAALAGAIAGFVGISYFGSREQRIRENDQYKRGAQVVEPTALTALVKQKSRETGDMLPRLKFGDPPALIPCRNEITPWVVCGRPQVGKSTLIKSLLDQISKLQLGKRIVFDSKADYTTSHLQPGDQIFCPAIDKRSIKWTIFNDIVNLSQIADMSAALIPESGKDPLWLNGARLIFEALLLHCWHEGKKTNAYLWECACLPADELKKIFQKTPGGEMAAALLDKPEVATSFSFTVNLKTFLKPLQLLARNDGPFCLRDWLTDGKNDGLFIVSTPDNFEILKPILNLFISTLLTAHKSLSDDRKRRIWYILDELGVLPKIPGLSDALNFGPSKGLCAILGFQSYQQIEEIYGRNTMESMLSSAGTNLIFSVGHDKTLEGLSKLIGEAEVVEYRGTLSTGISDNRHVGSSMDQLVKRRLVLPDEIKDLQPLNCYIKMLGYPASRLKLTYKPYESVAAANVPDPSFELSTYLRELISLKQQQQQEITAVPAAAEPTPVVVPASQPATDPVSPAPSSAPPAATEPTEMM